MPLFFSFSKFKQSKVSTSITQNSIVSIEVILFPFRNFFDSSSKIFAHDRLGNPKMPELIAGIEIDLKFFWDASNKQFWIAFLNLKVSFPSPILGPTACITALHGSLPAVVMTAEPTGTNPIFSLSLWIIAQPFLTITAATPPPCLR